MIRAFLRLGWTVDRQTGSHAILIKSGKRPFTIPVHPGTLKLGTARAILKAASISEDDFFDAY